jgi:trehalose-6-phosphatase
LKFDWRKYLPLYVGDSASDEVAFDWVNKRQGISVNVGKERLSAAQFYIESPDTAVKFLKQLIVLIKEKNGQK